MSLQNFLLHLHGTNNAVYDFATTAFITGVETHNENIMPQLLVIHYMFIDILICYTAGMPTYELNLFDAMCNCINMPVLSVFSIICIL